MKQPVGRKVFLDLNSFAGNSTFQTAARLLWANSHRSLFNSGGLWTAGFRALPETDRGRCAVRWDEHI